MSLRSRRIRGDVATVERFGWTPEAAAVRTASPSAVDVWMPVETHAGTTAVAAEPSPATAATPAGPPIPTADQQAHLAALEREAFTKGYAQGERAGLEAGGKRAEAMLRRLAQTLEELSGLRDNMVQQTERELVQLAVAIARRILQREVSVDPELTAALAHIALERIGSATPATVRLHPDDFAVVAGGQPGAWLGRQVEVRPDPSVARGGCLVESEFGSIDASMEAQVDEIARAVLGEPSPVVVARRGVA